MMEKHPVWLRKVSPDPKILTGMKKRLDGLNIQTVCEGAQCPNQGECFSRSTATFLLLGPVCTRNCRFCAIKNDNPLPIDKNEPANVAGAVQQLNLRHVVITSVARDDLDDGGSAHFAETIKRVRSFNPETSIEVLIPDFQGSAYALKAVIKSRPDVINHNIETVSRLYRKVRPQADYHRSLKLLRCVKEIDNNIVSKSGIMLGLGEERDEVLTAMSDLRSAECDLITIGQYLRPSKQHHPVERYIPPNEFEEFKNIAYDTDFKGAASASFVRSSYRAAELYRRAATF